MPPVRRSNDPRRPPPYAEAKVTTRDGRRILDHRGVSCPKNETMSDLNRLSPPLTVPCNRSEPRTGGAARSPRRADHLSPRGTCRSPARWPHTRERGCASTPSPASPSPPSPSRPPWPTPRWPASPSPPACTPCSSRSLAYAVFGAAPRVVIGPEGTVSLLVASALAPLAATGSTEYAVLAAALAILVGVVLLRRSPHAPRAGSPTTSRRPCSSGTSAGVAIVLILGQLGKLVGVSSDENNAIRRDARHREPARRRERDHRGGGTRRRSPRSSCSVASASASPAPSSSSSPASSRRGRSTSPSHGRQRHGSGAERAPVVDCPRCHVVRSRVAGRRRRSPSSSSASPTRSSPPAPSPLATTRSSTPTRSCWRSGSPTSPPDSPRACPWAPADRARRSTTTWEPPARSADWPPPRPSPSSCCSSPARSSTSPRRCSARSSCSPRRS